MTQWMLAIWSRSSAFSKTSLNIWKFTVHVLLKLGLENFEHYFARVWEHSLALPFFGIGMKTNLFQSCSHCWLVLIQQEWKELYLKKNLKNIICLQWIGYLCTSSGVILKIFNNWNQMPLQDRLVTSQNGPGWKGLVELRWCQSAEHHDSTWYQFK